MSRDFLGKGWRFPVKVDGAGRVVLSEFEEDIREAVRIILLTAKGERVMRPEFGTGLHNFVFETMSVTNIGTIQAAIQNGLIEWEPRIEVLAVSVEADPGEVGKLLINIDYEVRATNTQFNLVFPFYVGQV
ncbi:MAG TPA: GPW/gp25 family protein [Pyrinomonadaceae bacterium]|nr:GPW/gp25 family protein [Pyrinomonadaceae bacterium]